MPQGDEALEQLVERVDVLTLQPHDVLFLTVPPRDWSDDTVEPFDYDDYARRLQEALRDRVGWSGVIVVLPHGSRLEVVREADQKKA